MSMGSDTTWVGKKPIRRIGGLSDALSIASDLGFAVAPPPSQEELQSLASSNGERGDDLIRVLRELSAVQRIIADLQVELQGRKDDKNVAHLTHVSEMQKKIETLSRITQILKDVIQNKKQFSELLMKAASDYGALTASVSDFQWSQNFKEPPSVCGEMLRPIPVMAGDPKESLKEAIPLMASSKVNIQNIQESTSLSPPMDTWVDRVCHETKVFAMKSSSVSRKRRLGVRLSSFNPMCNIAPRRLKDIVIELLTSTDELGDDSFKLLEERLRIKPLKSSGRKISCEAQSGANRNTGRREKDGEIYEPTDQLDSLAEDAPIELARKDLIPMEEDSIPYQQGESSKSPNRAPEQDNTTDGSLEHAEHIQEQHGEEGDNTDTASRVQVEDAQYCAGSLIVKTISNEREEKKQMKTVTRESKIFSPKKSLAEDAGAKWEPGIKRSTRIKSRPLEFWRGERFLFGRVHESLPTVIGIKYGSPDKGALKVKSFVSDDYKELIDLAALH